MKKKIALAILIVIALPLLYLHVRLREADMYRRGFAAGTLKTSKEFEDKEALFPDQCAANMTGAFRTASFRR